MFKTLKINKFKHSFQISPGRSGNFKFLIIFIVFLYSIFQIPNSIYAQSLSLGLYPPLLEVTLKPGKSITQVYKLTNNGDVQLNLITSLRPFVPADTQGGVDIQETLSNSQVLGNNYFSFQNANLELGQRFTLKSGQEQQVVLKIKVPQDAPEGDYYRTLLFETLPDDNLSNSSTAKVRLGSNILLTVSQSGEPELNSEIAEFFIENCKFKISNSCVIDSFTKPQISLKIRNTGTAFFKPQGTITSKGLFGPKTTLILLPENILAGFSRQIRCATLSPDEAAQSRSGGTPVDCQLPNSILIGPYQIRLGFDLNQDGTRFTGNFLLIAFPFKLFFGLLVLFLLFLLLKTKLVRQQPQQPS